MYRSNSVNNHFKAQVNYSPRSLPKSYCLLKVRALLQHHHYSARTSYEIIPSIQLCKQKLAKEHAAHFTFSRS